MLYKIGDFSKETGVPIKTLRYYNEIDLFNPVEVDLFTGYRYYSSDQIEDLNLILKLKKVGFSLEEIKKYWNNFNNDIMLKKRDELIKNIDELKENISEIENLRSHIINGKIVLKESNKKIVLKKRGDYYEKYKPFSRNN